MALRRSRPLTFRPSGVSDAVDGSNTFPGSMLALTNLVPAPSTLGVFIPRPAAISLTTFPALNTPGVISALQVIGSRVYGMIASAKNAGKDEPFIYDLLANAFVSISGVSSSNVPTTQATTGDWTPPVIAAITATKIIITHPGFSGIGANFFGVIDITTFASPAWSSSNTATNALTAVPLSVAAFNGRAWYAVGNTVTFSNALDPLTVTNASQVLVIGDNQPVTAMAGLPSQSWYSGMIQSLIIFKGAEFMTQVTGDQATNNLAVNALNLVTGTLAPNAIVPTPYGLFFVAPDGLRSVTFQGQITDPVGADGQGVNVPFLNAINPTRMCGDFNENTLRISVQNGLVNGQPYQEWWYDFNLKKWTGPHTFASALISSVHVGTNSFVTAPVGVTANLFASRILPLLNSTYTENGTPLSFIYQTSLLPDNKEMAMNKVTQTAIAMSLPASETVTIQGVDEVGNILNIVSINAASTASTVWGAFTWGAAVWGSVVGYFKQFFVPWTAPLVFKQMTVIVTGASMAGTALGNLYIRYQILNYLLPF